MNSLDSDPKLTC
jgi:hypothetical protein